MGKIFISYSSCDRLVADQLLHYLEDHGIPCWISFRDITSGNFSGEITRALKAADIVLVICSTQSCRSEHVKNEVSLAFNQKKHFIPYLLEENPFDDDLEYFLSLKQHIKTRGSQEKDFALIEKFIHDYRGDAAAETSAPAAITPEPEPVKAPNKKTGLIISLTALVIAGIAAGILFLNKKPAEQPVADAVTAVAEATPQAKAVLPEDASDVTPASDRTVIPGSDRESPVAKTKAEFTFSGTIVNGYPDGFGKYTFKTRRRIDMHDDQERYAEAGDYIKGDFKMGHLNYGEWFDVAGNKKAFIKLGDNPDVEADQKMGKCAKP